MDLEIGQDDRISQFMGATYPVIQNLRGSSRENWRESRRAQMVEESPRFCICSCISTNCRLNTYIHDIFLYFNEFEHISKHVFSLYQHGLLCVD
ncbi:hypothetical protein DPEC_G00067530 [Dallia pectoralis]|uniref:Uncharacterized protein n=1 Tax=Dallia pectoralis TaxID=75939 RepID=A0ACC2H8I6_DALPE|nr:hypothetical protein DPEC_G00067530 [Dallia pectoralis]